MAKLDDLEQVLRLAGEDGHRAVAVGGDVPAVEHLAHALDVGLQRHLLVVPELALGLDPAGRLGHDRRDRGGPRRRRGQLGRVAGSGRRTGRGRGPGSHPPGGGAGRG